jgi:hypothetical protein
MEELPDSIRFLLVSCCLLGYQPLIRSHILPLLRFPIAYACPADRLVYADFENSRPVVKSWWPGEYVWLRETTKAVSKEWVTLQCRTLSGPEDNDAKALSFDYQRWVQTTGPNVTVEIHGRRWDQERQFRRREWLKLPYPQACDQGDARSGVR